MNVDVSDLLNKMEGNVMTPVDFLATTLVYNPRYSETHTVACLDARMICNALIVYYLHFAVLYGRT